MPDLFGFEPPATPFRDIPTQRPTVAEEKAVLVFTLNALLRTAPHALSAASVQQTRLYLGEHARALRVLRSRAASRRQLQAAIDWMRALT
ncbi:hypothetical protein [Pseudacidovorax intermedius]|uniref:hypothetical protein n=1 Tax=Pseudacidovorax intermedius TaxID=433924 RepID=UPI0026EA13A6|nr:hypothetical protein [Pseudacidovorax intermedius]